MSELARVALERHGPAVVARLAGEVDLSNAESVESQVGSGLGDASAVALDLAELRYLDSAGLGLVSRLASRLAAEGTTLRLVVPADAVVRRALVISGLADAIGVDETVEAALVALAERR
jgi:anti-sigma B factor antagonist